MIRKTRSRDARRAAESIDWGTKLILGSDFAKTNRDMGSLQSALFAIVYRYCVREDDDNGMLNMGVM